MTRVRQVEGQVTELSREELAAFREWFAKFDADMWDRQFEADVTSRKLNAMAERALRGSCRGPLCKALTHHASPDFWTCYRAFLHRLERPPTERSAW